RRDLTARDEARRLDDVERLVQQDVLSFDEEERIDVGMDVHPHRATVDQDLGRAVLVGTLEDSVGVRGRAELVDFFLQELDLLLRLLEDSYESLVLSLRVRELLASELIAATQGLELCDQAVEATPELRRLAAEQPQDVSQFLDVIAGSRSIRIGVRLGERIARRRRCRRDASHDVADESFSSG